MKLSRHIHNMNTNEVSALPITITQDGISVDEQFLVVTKTNSFLTHHLKKYYLSTSSVYQKVIYRTYWVEEKFEGPLTQQGMKLKITSLYPDIVGIEFAKTKTVYSKDHPRFLEVLQGKGLLLLQQDTPSLLDEATTYVIELRPDQKTVIPPNWHYTLVNTGKETLATIEMYQTTQELNSCHCDHKGSGVYVIERNGIPEIVKNSQYKNLMKYATVDPENYATRFKVEPTKNLISQLKVVTGTCTDDSIDCWKGVLDQANSGYYPF